MHCIFIDSKYPNIKICENCGQHVQFSGPKEELKRCCKALRSRGLGDTLSKTISTLSFGYGLQIAHETAKRMGLPDCGCDQRAEDLNSFFPYSSGNPIGV